MAFPKRLARLRKRRDLTQKALADLVGVRVLQIHRYENGRSQPTLSVLKRLAVALSVSADELVFGRRERLPDRELMLQFEAVSRLGAEEKRMVRQLIEGVILRHRARQWRAGHGKKEQA